ACPTGAFDASSAPVAEEPAEAPAVDPFVVRSGRWDGPWDSARFASVGPESGALLRTLVAPRAVHATIQGGHMAQATSPPMPAAARANDGPIGRQRNILKQILLSIVTLGFYGVYWAYQS